MNLKHLHVFWTVSRLGGVSRAAEQLSLTPQTVSGHIRHLEEDLGAALFRPVGRGLELPLAGTGREVAGPRQTGMSRR